MSFLADPFRFINHKFAYSFTEVLFQGKRSDIIFACKAVGSDWINQDVATIAIENNWVYETK